jgi:hypothetical protein
MSSVLLTSKTVRVITFSSVFTNKFILAVKFEWLHVMCLNFASYIILHVIEKKGNFVSNTYFCKFMKKKKWWCLKLLLVTTNWRCLKLLSVTTNFDQCGLCYCRERSITLILDTNRVQLTPRSSSHPGPAHWGHWMFQMACGQGIELGGRSQELIQRFPIYSYISAFSFLS